MRFEIDNFISQFVFRDAEGGPMPMHDNSTTIQQLKDSVEQFKADRDWGQYHTPQDLAVSISI